MISEFSHLRIYVFKEVPYKNCMYWICILLSDPLLHSPGAWRVRQAGSGVVLVQRQAQEPQVDTLEFWWWQQLCDFHF